MFFFEKSFLENLSTSNSFCGCVAPFYPVVLVTLPTQSKACKLVLFETGTTQDIFIKFMSMVSQDIVNAMSLLLLLTNQILGLVIRSRFDTLLSDPLASVSDSSVNRTEQLLYPLHHLEILFRQDLLLGFLGSFCICFCDS